MKLKSTFLLTVLFLFLGITTSFAANWQDEGVPVKPSQTDSTFHITTAEELAWVAMKTNSGASFSGYTIELMNDIDISSKEWTPIGNANANFKGDFEGNNHTINGLNIGTQNTPVEYSSVGLFGYTCDANIRNIGLTNVAIYSSGDYVGGLVGYTYGDNYSNKYNIKNCYTTGNVSGGNYVGGLVGYNIYGRYITNCYATGSVSGKDYVGGLVGYSYSSINITNCYATGSVSGKDYVGGLIGYYSYSNININITNCYATGSVSGKYYVGGLVGYSYSSFNITHCYATGDISGEDHVGGLVGYNKGSDATNCYATGDISGKYYVGGLIGDNSSDDIINCYATGDINGERYVGGLIGDNSSGDITNCYWNNAATQTVNGTKLSNSEKLGIGTGNDGEDIYSKTSAEMKSEDFAALLNEYVKADDKLYSWQINTNINEGYPIFSEQFDKNLFWIGNAQEPELVNDVDYKITNAEELAWVSKKTMEGERFEGYTFYLMNDIDLSGKQWTPIGGFAGTFDGCGHTISNMTIGTEKYSRVYAYSGLFGYCYENANIKNLGMKNVFVNATSYVGGIIGGNYKKKKGCYISNCYVTGSISGISSVGGIAGNCEKIENSYSYADIKATGDNVGGICGSSEYYINNCYSISNVEGNSTVGAICGSVNSTLNCYWNSDCTLIADGLELNGSNKKGVAYGTDNTTAKSLAELKQADTYTNWDFTDVWGISASFNDGLPYLKWQLEGADVVKVSEITLSETVLNLTSKSKYQLKAAVKPSNAADTSITWSSSDENVAVVDKNGIVTAISDGEAVITAKNGDVTAECTVTVTTPDYIVCEISDMKIKDSAGKELSKLPSGNFIAELSINVKKDTDKKGYVIVSAYDENGVLVDMGYIYTDINSLDDISFGILIRGTNVANIKAFVWEDLQNITPLANSIEL